MANRNLKIAAGVALGVCAVIASVMIWTRHAAQEAEQDREQQAKKAVMDRRALNQEEMRKDFLRQLQNKEEIQAAARRAASAASQAGK